MGITYTSEEIEKTIAGLEFEAGRLVKIEGQRPEYLDGATLLKLVRLYAGMLLSTSPTERDRLLSYHLSEVIGTFDEWRALPVKSLLDRHLGAVEASRRLTAVPEQHGAAASRQSIEALQLVCETVDRPPEPNCSCHISPPCGDCVEFGGLREMFAGIDAALQSASIAPQPLT